MGVLGGGGGWVGLVFLFVTLEGFFRIGNFFWRGAGKLGCRFFFSFFFLLCGFLRVFVFSGR